MNKALKKYLENDGSARLNGLELTCGIPEQGGVDRYTETKTFKSHEELLKHVWGMNELGYKCLPDPLKLAVLRTEAGFSQEDFSKKLNISLRTYIRIENEESKIPLGFIDWVIKFLKNNNYPTPYFI